VSRATIGASTFLPTGGVRICVTAWSGLLITCAGVLLAGMPGHASAQRVTARLTALRAQPLATWHTYLGPAWGVEGDVRAGHVRVATGVVLFGPTLAVRSYRGTGPPVEITTESSVLTLTAGPAADIGWRRVRVELAAGAGLARFSNASRAVIQGDAAQFDRSTSFDDLTWLLAGSLHVDVQPWAGRIGLTLGVRGARTGKTRIVREDNLTSGTISGLYVPPIPTAAVWIDGALGVRIWLAGRR